MTPPPPSPPPPSSPPSNPPLNPVALLTGAGSGIGRAIALQLAQRGYRIALAGRRIEPLRETGKLTGLTEGTSWIAIQCDVGDPAQVEAMVHKTAEHFGRLDALINNAGWTGMKPIEQHTADEIRKLFEINAMGPIWAIAKALPIMLEQGKGGAGVIVNVSSMATTDPFPGLGIYGSAKAACETICLAIRNEHPQAESNIRAYCIALGAVETDLLRSIVDEDTLPKSAAMPPDRIAAKVVACVIGETELENGQTERVTA
ncbi:MAG: NADP-dependent 3-hydroxy acid dehydrogenase YdfG [Phycisphaerales bacterium]|jgi:NADP-dependent 3-hydroxy acid dehydrogenase YdfG